MDATGQRCEACSEGELKPVKRVRSGSTGEGIGALLLFGALIPLVLAIVFLVQRETSSLVASIAFIVPALMALAGWALLRTRTDLVCSACGRVRGADSPPGGS
ncbi:MAG: hypothetical protein ABIP29_01465 [Candidatus Eisenbacteria bacterium]